MPAPMEQAHRHESAGSSVDPVASKRPRSFTGWTLYWTWIVFACTMADCSKSGAKIILRNFSGNLSHAATSPGLKSVIIDNQIRCVSKSFELFCARNAGQKINGFFIGKCSGSGWPFYEYNDLYIAAACNCSNGMSDLKRHASSEVIGLVSARDS